MNICYIANARIPSKQAHGIQIMKMCEAFAALGHEVTLVVPNRRTWIEEDPYVYYGVKPSFAIKKLWTIDTVPYGKLGFCFHQLVFMLAVFFYAPQKKFDLVYARDDLSIALLSFFTKRLMWESHMGRHNVVVARILRAGIKIVVITHSLKEFYLSYGVPSSNVLVAHDAVDLEEFSVAAGKQEARQKLGLPLNKKIVMYIGALKEWKGHRILLEASKQFAEDVQVAIIGGGEKVVSALQKTYPQAIFLGSQPYRDLPVNQRAAEVLVIPNLETNDPFERFTSPLKVFAHMASDVPIVASYVPALREVLTEKNALFFKPGDSADLTAKIQETLANPAAAAERAKQARADAKEYTWHKRAENIIKHLAR
ncbi:MAG: glycosyltransferase [Candidatus Adlerbacteria bacterium]|nr:glycosyltransferase [Candidatus Adlerbacteria bacterium]